MWKKENVPNGVAIPITDIYPRYLDLFLTNWPRPLWYVHLETNCRKQEECSTTSG